MRPLPTLLAAAALAGAVAGQVLAASPGSRLAALGAAAACAAVAAAIRRRSSRVRLAPYLAVLVVLACTLLAPRPERVPEPPRGLGSGVRIVRVTGRVASAPDLLRDPDRGASTLRFQLRESSSGDRLLVHVGVDEDDPAPALLPGDPVRLVGRLAAPPRPGNPGEPDLRGVGVRSGVRAWLDVRSPAAVRRVPGRPASSILGLRRVGERVRSAVGRRLDAAFRPREAALARCLLIGDRRALDTDRAEAFRRAGLAHLLAVSGLHVVLLVACGRFALDRLWPGRRRGMRDVLALAALLTLYCAVCRFGTPVVRASLFLVLAATCRAVGRRARALDLLAATVLVVLLADPVQVAEAGFQLSFAAVFGLCTFGPRLRGALFPSLELYEAFPEAISPRRLAVLRHASAACAASGAAWIATAPVLAVHFGELQPLGLLANPLAVPLAGPAVWTALGGAVLGDTARGVTSLLGLGGLGAVEGTARLIAAVPGAQVAADTPLPALPFVAGGLLLLGLVRRRWTRRHLLLPVAATLLLVVPRLPAGDPGPSVVALDTGHGLCILLRGPERDGRRAEALVDAGGLGRRVGARRIVPALRALGVATLDAVWVSHADHDHCGDVAAVLERVPAGEVLVPEGFGVRPAARALLAQCRAAAIPVRRTARGRVWRRRGLTIRVLHPRPGRPGPVDNDGSLVLDVSLAAAGPEDMGLRALLPGDVQFEALHSLAADATLREVDVLLLPHHGRVDPEAARTLWRRTRPRVVVSSATSTTEATPSDAWITGRDGAVRVRPGGPPEGFRGPGRR